MMMMMIMMMLMETARPGTASPFSLRLVDLSGAQKVGDAI
jgi:hypothetical protein